MVQGLFSFLGAPFFRDILSYERQDENEETLIRNGARLLVDHFLVLELHSSRDILFMIRLQFPFQISWVCKRITFLPDHSRDNQRGSGMVLRKGTGSQSIMVHFLGSLVICQLMSGKNLTDNQI